MLRWVVAFIEENEPSLNQMRVEREKDRRERDQEEEWSAKDRV